MLVRINNKVMTEAATRLKKSVKQALSDYDKYKGRECVNYWGKEDSVNAPDLSKDDFRAIQDAFNNNDISYCMDVVDQLNATLDLVEKKRKEMDALEAKLDTAFDAYKESVKGLAPYLGGYNIGDKRWGDVDFATNPIVVDAYVKEEVVNAVRDLRDFILDSLS